MRSFSLLGLAFLAACAGPPSENAESSESAIVNGVETDDHPGVGRLWYGSDSAGWMTCTASLIRPRVVLTAAHCVTGKEDSGVTVEFRGKKYYGEEWAWSGSYWLDGPLAQSYDWAIVRLNEDVADVDWMLMTTDLPPSSTWFTAVGFGRDEHGRSGTKKTAAAWITHDYHAYFQAEAFSTRYDGASWASTCYGDSGGPALDEQGRIFGIFARMRTSCDGWFRYTKVSIEWDAIHDRLSAWGQ